MSELYTSFKICSINNLLVPYGLVVPPVLHSSVIGITSGLPYTVAEELNTNFLTLFALITSNNVNVPEILFV